MKVTATIGQKDLFQRILKYPNWQQRSILPRFRNEVGEQLGALYSLFEMNTPGKDGLTPREKYLLKSHKDNLINSFVLAEKGKPLYLAEYLLNILGTSSEQVTNAIKRTLSWFNSSKQENSKFSFNILNFLLEQIIEVKETLNESLLHYFDTFQKYQTKAQMHIVLKYDTNKTGKGDKDDKGCTAIGQLTGLISNN
ncbi:MAG: hypothetical protein SFU25_05115, partial [Candidatus Caenarcaniphilales bacterium]|nr:hypothetical protein [Candidatus Caenarcaniphilales bacterium]